MSDVVKFSFIGAFTGFFFWAIYMGFKNNNITPDPKVNEVWIMHDSNPFEEKFYHVKVIDVKEDWVKYVYLTDTTLVKTNPFITFKAIFDKKD